MAQLILSNRLKGFQDSLGEFGQTWGQQRQLKLQNQRQAEQDAIAAQAAQRAGETHGLQMKQGQLALSEAERARANGMEMDSLANQLTQADAGQVMGPSAQGDFQAGMADPWAPMKDRLRAKMFTKSGTPTTSEDVKKGREDQAFKGLTLRETERRANESHASQLATDKVQRTLYGSQAEKNRADANRPPAGQAPKTPRDLSDGGIKAISEQGTKLVNVHSIVDSFKPEFTGQLAGGMSNKVGKITGGNVVGANPDQVGWWENYQGYVNQVRNDLFGAALTPGEKAEFEKTIVKPNTDPEVAKTNLLRQWEIVKGATERSANTYAAGNVNREQIGAALGGNYDPNSGKVGLQISWDKRKPDAQRGASGSFGAPAGGSKFKILSVE